MEKYSTKEEYIIKCENLGFVYADDDEPLITDMTPALTGVNFGVKRGEYLAVLGHNGSGKSTLAKLLNMILVPTVGKIYIDGVDITVNGSDSVYMKPIRMVPHVEPSCKNPTLKFGESSIKIFTEIPSECNLYFDGESCVVTDAVGNVLDRPSYEGTPVVFCGDNEINFERESNEELSRIKLTVGVVGEKLQ